MKKLKNIMLSIIYILIFLYLIAFVPNIWGKKPLVVISGSMEQTLNVGSLVYYKTEEINKFQKNDIVVFKSGEHIISHRIVDVAKDGFVTKGDANNTNDFKKVKHSQVIGKANNWCIPYYGYYVSWIHTHKLLIYVFIIILLFDLLFESYLKKRSKEYEIVKNH